MAEPQSPKLIKAIPNVVANVGSPFGPVDLKEYIKNPNQESGLIKFFAELAETESGLPDGIICTMDGLLGGIPRQTSVGVHRIILIAENDASDPLLIEMQLTVFEKLSADQTEFLTSLKSKVWEALGKDLPIPEMNDLLSRPISAVEVYYLLQRFAVLSVWDVYNLEPPGDKTLLTLPGANQHYNIYDRGSCIVGAPKDLYSHERTLADALQTATVIAREVHKRGWTVEFAGFNKMARAAWIELQIIGDKTGKHLEILHYAPSPEDVKIYERKSQADNKLTPG
jgi:hypothetical protein